MMTIQKRKKQTTRTVSELATFQPWKPLDCETKQTTARDARESPTNMKIVTHHNMVTTPLIYFLYETMFHNFIQLKQLMISVPTYFLIGGLVVLVILLYNTTCKYLSTSSSSNITSQTKKKRGRPFYKPC